MLVFRPLALVGLTLFACAPHVWEPTLVSGDGAGSSSGDEQAYLLAHLESGHVVVFSEWSVPDEGADRLSGHGTRFDAARAPLSTGTVDLPLDSVVLLEANRSETVSAFAMASLMVWTAVSAGATVACVADPKGCFGSCPTFYVGVDDERPFAEGFSSSFARALEATDVDRWPSPAFGGDRVSLVMRNEAPETHAVRTVRLRAVSVSGASDIGRTPDGRYHAVTGSFGPEACRSSSLEGSCLGQVGAADGLEYWAPTDSSDLAAPETVHLSYRVPEGVEAGTLALSIRARQSLVSTFLFYQTIAHLGDHAGAWLAALERGDERLLDRALGLARVLGGIDVEVFDGASWVPAGRFDEAGPIAADTWVLPLNLTEPHRPLQVRLRMSRGLWRLDEVRLVALGDERASVAVEPSEVETIAGPVSGDLALARLRDPERQLTTQRGEAYRLHFDLPPEWGEVALFLESRGYYYEWMRPEWKGEEDAAMARLTFADPAEALVRMAPLFKALEPGMEEAFWSSRFRADRGERR